MKEKITTEIDSELKVKFDKTRRYHKLSYKDIIEKGIRDVLTNVDPEKLIEYDIEKSDHEQEERRQALMVLKNKPQQTKLMGFVDPEIAKRREKLLLKDYESIIKLGSRVNWGYIIQEYKFKDKKEAMEWISSHIGMIKNA